MQDDLNRVISRGFVSHSQSSIENWYDRRICAVIRGQNGFAAIHYTIFEDAVRAKLVFKVTDVAPDGAPGCQVRGVINAWYSNYDYSTHYEKKYYRSSLFEKEEWQAVKLSAGAEIPLVKSAAAVLVCGMLVVGGSIDVRDGNYHDTLEVKTTFTPLESDDEKRVGGRHFGLSVCGMASTLPISLPLS